MAFVELFLIAVGLSMDAFAVSVSKGLGMRQVGLKHMLTAGLYFGFFQAAMPLIGYFLYGAFAEAIVNFDHWIACVLLVGIGANMIIESTRKDEEPDCSMDCKTMLLLAVATSIDALAVGISFGALQTPIWSAVCLIGVTTFILSMLGVKLGGTFGAKYKSKAEMAGGVILILMGIKVLLEHLGVLSF